MSFCSLDLRFMQILHSAHSQSQACSSTKMTGWLFCQEDLPWLLYHAEAPRRPCGSGLGRPGERGMLRLKKKPRGATGRDFQEDWGATVYPGCGLGNEGKRERGGRELVCSEPLGVPSSAGDRGHRPCQDSRLAGGRQKLGTQPPRG